MKGRDYFTLQFIRSSSPEFLFMQSPHLEIFPLLPVVISAFSFLPPLVNTLTVKHVGIKPVTFRLLRV